MWIIFGSTLVGVTLGLKYNSLNSKLKYQKVNFRKRTKLGRENKKLHSTSRLLGFSVIPNLPDYETQIQT